MQGAEEFAWMYNDYCQSSGCRANYTVYLLNVLTYKIQNYIRKYNHQFQMHWMKLQTCCKLWRMITIKKWTPTKFYNGLTFFRPTLSSLWWQQLCASVEQLMYQCSRMRAMKPLHSFLTLLYKQLQSILPINFTSEKLNMVEKIKKTQSISIPFRVPVQVSTSQNFELSVEMLKLGHE